MRMLCALMCLVGLTVVGCTSVQAGTPVAAGRASATEEETYGAPRVSEPVDASAFLTRPCAVLTPAQLAEFGISQPGESDTDSAIARHSGPGCLWEQDNTPTTLASTFDVSFLTGNKHGLSDTYRGRDRFRLFEEITVDDHPAVINDMADVRLQGTCNITVGISDTLTFRTAEIGGPRGQDTCVRTKRFAAAILTTLKAGA
jgi:Protein of unknown function (DUF3558)